ncbi:MAG: hypothetical protein WKG32_20895, partial [Gemmatimonadaceae bacterium]
MSTPKRLYRGVPCCDGDRPVPLWQLITVFPSMAAQNRARLIEGFTARGLPLAIATQAADELWCRRCATFLEDLRDGLEEGGPIFLRCIATVAAFVPGIGTGVATALGAAASLAEGNSIDDAMLDAALAAVPAGAAFRMAGAVGKSLLEGEAIGEALLAGGREVARAQGGVLAAAAYDAVIAIAQGKALQDAGFAALKSLAQGNDIAERAASYAETIARAAQSDLSVEELLTSELAAEVGRVAGRLAPDVLRPVLDRVQANLDMLNAGSDALAAALGVAEPIARAAQAILRAGDGSMDLALLSAVAPPKALGRTGTAKPFHGNVCERAADARARNSPVAPALEALCVTYRRTGAGSFASSSPPRDRGAELRLLGVPRAPSSPRAPSVLVTAPRVAASLPSSSSSSSSAGRDLA